MKIENQVCSVSQAIALKELGITQHKSYFSYGRFCPDPTGQHEGYSILSGEHDHRPECEHSEFVASAFTVSELSVMIGIGEQMEQNLELIPDSEFEKMNEPYGELISTILNPEYLATVLIYLLENNLIGGEICNKNLSES